MVYAIFTEVCNDHHYIILEYCHYPKQKSVPIINYSPFFFFPISWQLLSVSIELLTLDISYEWNSTICGPFWPLSFTWHNIVKFIRVAACFSTSLHRQIIFTMWICHYFNHSLVNRYFGFSHFLVLYMMLLWTDMYKFMCGNVFLFCVYTEEWNCWALLNILRNYQTVPQSSCTIWPYYQ